MCFADAYSFISSCENNNQYTFARGFSNFVLYGFAIFSLNRFS